MANNTDSNFSRKVMPVFMESFQQARVLSKNVNTQLFAGKFNPSSGPNIDVKRPTDYRTQRTAGGDISGGTRSDIISGKATATVQDYFTVDVEYGVLEEALELNQLDALLAPMATRIVNDFETDFASYMMKNTNLLAGTVGTAVSTWGHVANMSSTMGASGVPRDKKWCAAVNPYTQTLLAGDQRALGAVDSLVKSANDAATISDNFGGMRVMSATSLASYTTGVGADRAGTLSANPVVTYVGAKDTMTQSLAVTALQANLVVAAGETITITGRNRLNLASRTAIVDGTGGTVLFSGTVTETVTLGASGEGTLVVSGAAIYEANGQYNTTASAAISGDVVTLGGAASTLIQPNLFWHPDAFTIASVKLPKLYSTDTVATTEDGLQLRISKYADGDANKQIVRFDFQPAFGVLNPFFAGQGFGS